MMIFGNAYSSAPDCSKLYLFFNCIYYYYFLMSIHGLLFLLNGLLQCAQFGAQFGVDGYENDGSTSVNKWSAKH